MDIWIIMIAALIVVAIATTAYFIYQYMIEVSKSRKRLFGDLVDELIEDHKKNKVVK